MAKTFVITGASAGIGEALALAYASRRNNVVLASRDEVALARVAERCERAGGKALVVKTDVGDETQCKHLIDEAVKAFGGIDVLVNNAGLTMWARFDEITDITLFERLMRVNYLGTVYCTYHALPYLKKSKGLLVGVSSLTGKTGVPTRSAYGASKHAMQGLMDSLRVELRGAGVGVLVVSPGFVRTDVRAKALGGDGKPREVSPREEDDASTMSLEECIDLIVRAIDRRQREVIMTARAKWGMWLKLVAPGLVDRIAERAVREKS
ncbi:MAG TPA: SDR family oxidoreductase [Polyangiaceae bacterium]